MTILVSNILNSQCQVTHRPSLRMMTSIFRDRWQMPGPSVFAVRPIQWPCQGAVEIMSATSFFSFRMNFWSIYFFPGLSLWTHMALRWLMTPSGESTIFPRKNYRTNGSFTVSKPFFGIVYFYQSIRLSPQVLDLLTNCMKAESLAASQLREATRSEIPFEENLRKEKQQISFKKHVFSDSWLGHMYIYIYIHVM